MSAAACSSGKHIAVRLVPLLRWCAPPLEGAPVEAHAVLYEASGRERRKVSLQRETPALDLRNLPPHQVYEIGHVHKGELLAPKLRFEISELTKHLAARDAASIARSLRIVFPWSPSASEEPVA